MALTIRKKSGLIIPKTPSLILPPSIFSKIKNEPEGQIIIKVIKEIINETVGISSRSGIKRLVFFPIYKRHAGEKEISKIYLKYRTRNNIQIVDVLDIEKKGVTLLEFLDYIITNGAKEIKSPEKALDIM